MVYVIVASCLSPYHDVSRYTICEFKIKYLESNEIFDVSVKLTIPL